MTLDMRLHYWVSASEKLPGRVSVYHGPLLLAARENDLHLTRQALESASRIPGDGLVNLQIQTNDGSCALLTDYYTAGKDGQPYTSWLACDMEPLSAAPIWCAR